ncbi:MAG: glutathione S-transferase family protein [Brevundimonas sp.]
MLTLFHAPWSRSSRLIWLLEELKADYQIQPCDIARMDGSGRRDPANPHPDGKVPALMHEGALVTESASIALYLTDLFPQSGLGAAPGDPDRAAYLTWLFWTTGEMEPAYWSRITGETDARTLAGYDAVNRRILTALQRGPYLMGRRFTAVDVLVASALSWGREHAPQSPRLDVYLKTVLARSANRRAQVLDAPALELMAG